MDPSPLFTPATPPAGGRPTKWVPTPNTVRHVARRPAVLPWLCLLCAALFVAVLFGASVLLGPAALALALTVLLARRWRVAVAAAERRNAEARSAPGRHARDDEPEESPSDTGADLVDTGAGGVDAGAGQGERADQNAGARGRDTRRRDARRPDDEAPPSSGTARVPGQRGGPPSGADLAGRHRAPSA